MARQRIAGNSLTASEVLAYAQRIADMGVDMGVNMCQRFVRQAFGSPGGAPTALAAWQASKYKHREGTPPPGAAVYWGGGVGHVAISAGNGMVYSTDVREPGKVDLVDMEYITKQWGKPLLGWSEDNNERRIIRFDAKPVQEGAGSKYDPVYSGNTTKAGGDESTTFSKRELRERYGFTAAFFDSSPELQKLIDKAVEGQWTPEEFEVRFRASKWYRKHTESEREWVLLSTSQPEEAQRQIDKVRTDIVAQYRQMGVPVGRKRVDKIARVAVVQGWTSQEVTNAVAAEFDYNPEQAFGGVAGETIDQFRDMAAAYVVPLSEKSMEKWTRSVLRGEATPDAFESYLKDQAKSLWADPGLHAAVDRGVTVEDYLSPYKEMAARTLEINPDEVDWLNPRWQQAVFSADEKGERRMQSLADWQRTLRTDTKYGYDKTSQAREAAASFAAELGQMFGRA